jgi:hypothetical protein
MHCLGKNYCTKDDFFLMIFTAESVPVLSLLRVHLRTVGFLGNFALVENSVHHTGQLVLPSELHVLSVLVLKKLGSIKYIVYWPSTLFHHRKQRFQQ